MVQEAYQNHTDEGCCFLPYKMKYVLTTTEPTDVDITYINQPDVHRSLVAFDGLLGEFLGILSLEIPCPQVIAREMVI